MEDTPSYPATCEACGITTDELNMENLCPDCDDLHREILCQQCGRNFRAEFPGQMTCCDECEHEYFHHW